MSFTSTTYPVARKQHGCSQCRRLIQAGERHTKCVGVNEYTDYHIGTLRLCDACETPIDPEAAKARLQRTVDAWNAAHPIGTLVRYWTGVREGEGRTGRTRSAAELLGGHTPVVWVTGPVGCVALGHVEVVG